MRTTMPTGSSAVRTAVFFLFAVTLAFTAFATTAAPAHASPVTLTFDNGQLSAGFFRDRVVLPASSTFPSPDLPTPQRTDIQLNGDLANGQVTIPATTNTGAQFPYMQLEHPLEPGLMIPITLRLNAPGLSGTWDAATGAMTLAGKVDIVVVTGKGASFPLPDSFNDAGVPPLGLFARCRFNDVPMSFSTANQSPITAQPFTGGFGKNGALTASWDSLADSVSENGGDCGQLNQITTADGGLWLSNGVVEPKPQPVEEPTCETDLSLCPPPTYTDIDAVRLRPGRKKVRPGQKVVLRLRVHNSGNIAAKKVKIRIRSTNKAFKVRKKITMTIPAGRWAKKKLVVKVKRNAKRFALIKASKNGWTAQTYLKLKPKPSKRR